MKIKHFSYKAIASALFAFGMVLLLGGMAQAGTTITENRPVYNIDSLNPFMTYFKNQNESINMETGVLNVTVTDLYLPGRGGLDFALTRTYASNLAAAFKTKVYVDDNGDYHSYAENDAIIGFSVGTGWVLNIPCMQSTLMPMRTIFTWVMERSIWLIWTMYPIWMGIILEISNIHRPMGHLPTIAPTILIGSSHIQGRYHILLQ